MAIGTWIKDARQVYFDNATSVRDYRVQLRGNRSVIFFGLYLIVLITVSMFVYSESVVAGAYSVVDAQRLLREFYGITIGILGGVVALVAPALSATAVVLERQRRSLDLIFSAPVSPRYYLVGKMISSYRYTWMLLVLALPVTAACVLLGGASWMDVLQSYLLLSVHGIVFTALALLMSTVSTKPVSAVIWSYVAAGFYLMVTFAGSASSMMTGMQSMNAEVPFYAVMNPFLVSFFAGSYTLIGSLEIPNWFISIFVAGAISQLCLLGAGVMLSPKPEVEIRKLRIYSLIYFSFLVGYSAWQSNLSMSQAGLSAFWFLSPLVVVIPFLSCFGIDAERRYRPNGMFNIRNIFDGTPAGALPYLLLLIATGFVSSFVGVFLNQSSLAGIRDLGIFAIYTVGFWVLFWAIGRYASSSLVGLKTARAIQFAVFVLIVCVPVPFIATIESQAAWDAGTFSLWNLYILRPAFVTEPILALVYGVGTLGAAALIARAAEQSLKQKMMLPPPVKHEAPLPTP